MAAATKSKRWVVPIEASVTGYIVVDALSEEDAVDVADGMIEDANFGITEDGPSIDLADFDRLVDKGQVFSGMALEGVARYRKPRSKSTTKKATTTTAKKKTTKGPAKGRARGGAASSDKSKTKKTTATKKAAKNPSGTSKKKTTSTGRRRGVSAKN